MKASERGLCLRVVHEVFHFCLADANMPVLQNRDRLNDGLMWCSVSERWEKKSRMHGSAFETPLFNPIPLQQ